MSSHDKLKFWRKLQRLAVWAPIIRSFCCSVEALFSYVFSISVQTLAGEQLSKNSFILDVK